MTAVTVPGVKVVSGISNLQRLMLGAALGILSTILFIFAFQPFSIWPLAFIAYVPILLAENAILPLRWAGLSRAIGVGGFIAIFLTMVFGFGPIAVTFFIIGAVIAAIGILATPALRRFHLRTNYRWFLLQGAVDLVGIELIRSFIPPINTHAFWAQTAYSQPWLIQPLAIFGVYGLSFVWMLINFGLALAAIMWFNGRFPWANPLPLTWDNVKRNLAIAGAVFAVWLVISLIILFAAPAASDTVRVAAVQHGFPKAGHIELETEEARLTTLTEQTRLAAAEGAQLIVWPELSFGFDPQVKHTATLQALAAETNAYLLIGYGVVTPNDEWRNEAVMLTPTGEFLPVYGKNFATKPGEPDVVTAGSYPVYQTPFGNLATIICNDINYPLTTRTLAQNGAQLATLPTLESGAPGLGWEQRTQAVLRAVESRVAVVKADSNGIQMIIDPYGRIVDQKTMKTGEAGILVGDVALGTGNTLYAKWGNWFGWLGLVGLVIFTVAVNRKPKGVS